MLKVALLFSVILLTTLTSCGKSNTDKNAPEKAEMEIEKTLRHIVLFKFKDDASDEDVDAVVNAFQELPSLIDEISAFEWGTNNSPEGLNKEFTHSFLVSFTSEEDRDIYLTHPEHLAFVEILKPHLDDVLVLDYWTE